MKEHQLQEVASGQEGRWIDTTLLERLNLRGQFHIIGHHHPAHGGRDSFHVLSAEDGGTAKATNLSPVISSTQSMHTVFDDVKTMPVCQVKRGVKLHRDAEGVLEDQDLRSRGNPLRGLLEVDIVVIQPAINIDWSSTGIADRVGHDNVGRDLEKDFVSGPNSQGKQETIESHASMAKAVRVADTNLPGEGLLVLENGRSLDQLAWVSQIVQRNQAISKGRCPPKDRQAAGCNLREETPGSAVSCPLDDDVFHEDALLYSSFVLLAVASSTDVSPSAEASIPLAILRRGAPGLNRSAVFMPRSINPLANGRSSGWNTKARCTGRASNPTFVLNWWSPAGLLSTWIELKP